MIRLALVFAAVLHLEGCTLLAIDMLANGKGKFTLAPTCSGKPECIPDNKVMVYKF